MAIIAIDQVSTRGSIKRDSLIDNPIDNKTLDAVNKEPLEFIQTHKHPFGADTTIPQRNMAASIAPECNDLKEYIIYLASRIEHSD